VSAAYIKVSEMAKRLKVSRHLIYKGIDLGLIPHVRLGPHRIRIPESWVDDPENLRRLADRLTA